MSDEDPYFYPGTHVLRNKLGILDAGELERVERRLVADRMIEGVPHGDFDLDHLKAIHRHLFQDVYPWAGEVRTVTLAKGESHFMPPTRIAMGMADVHRRILAEHAFAGADPATFAHKAARIIGDINYLHPFREGNGRTQLQYLKQLGERAGHGVDLTRLSRDPWIDASMAAQEAHYGAMARCIERALTQD